MSAKHSAASIKLNYCNFYKRIVKKGHNVVRSHFLPICAKQENLNNKISSKKYKNLKKLKFSRIF